LRRLCVAQTAGNIVRRTAPQIIRPLVRLLIVGTAVLALGACAANRTMQSPDYSSLSQSETQSTLMELAARYRQSPHDKGVMIHYAAALRAAGQPAQAVSVLEIGIDDNRDDPDINIAYAKALTAAGRFEQALVIVDRTIRPESPDWNMLSVRGAILDQLGRNAEARASYTQALTIAPYEASLEANLGLSFSMTNDLVLAEQHLRRAVGMPGATSQIRQNLALVVGLQGRFDESRAMFGAELPPDQVEANMAYIRALLTQQNRWQLIEGQG
jgi:Flp pilus assembly protein TadD